MAIRPVFISNCEGSNYVKTHSVEFEWFPGFSLSQKQKSVASLHGNFRMQNGCEILEVSRKSTNSLGIELSAFNLHLTYKDIQLPVEIAFQSSKVFDTHGKVENILQLKPVDAKKAIQILHKSHKLIGFDFFGESFPLTPKTLFYDWLYFNALWQNKELVESLIKENYLAFTDIAFNPKSSINCQAYSVALFVSLYRRGFINETFLKRENFVAFFSNTASKQMTIFD